MDRRWYQAVLIFISFLTGCTTVTTDVDVPPRTDLPEPDRQGIYHQVGRGETLWRIAKTYDVDLNDIIRANQVSDAAKIEKNQLIFVPGALEIRDIILDTPEYQDTFVWPIRGKILHFYRDRKNGRVNDGIDIQAHSGETVLAAKSGRVVFADYLPGYGFTVILDHKDGFHTIYARTAKLLVEAGDFVFRGNEIALAGVREDPAQIHFQVRRNTIEDNPLYYLP